MSTPPSEDATLAHLYDVLRHCTLSVESRVSLALRRFSMALYMRTSSVLQKDPQRCCSNSLIVSTYHEMQVILLLNLGHCE